MKILQENELKDRAKYHAKKNRKKKNVKGWFVELNAGNPEANMGAFNHATDIGSAPTASTPSSGGMGESLITEDRQKNLYEIIWVDRETDSTMTNRIRAYSAAQAAKLLKLNYGKYVYKIVDITCLEDNSFDDGVQLSFFDRI